MQFIIELGKIPESSFSLLINDILLKARQADLCPMTISTEALIGRVAVSIAAVPNWYIDFPMLDPTETSPT
jgi:hypothetical protein